MIKFLRCLLIFTLISSQNSIAQFVTIPDVLFRNALQAKYPSCFNSSHQMDTTCSAIVNAQTWIVPTMGAVNLDGLQYFKSLTAFEWSHPNLISIPAFPPALQTIRITWCENLTSIPPVPAGLKELSVSNCKLNALPALPAGLIKLDCLGNLVTSIPALGNSLEHLQVSKNKLISLPTLPATLTTLECYSNELTSLPALPAKLTSISCSINKLTSLPALPDSLDALGTDSNFLTSLPTLPATLTYLYCGGNQFTSLPPMNHTGLYNLSITNNRAPMPFFSSLQLPATLNMFDCSRNGLTALPLLPVSLRKLNCERNNLTVFPTLPDGIWDLFFDYNRCSYIPSLPADLRTMDAFGNDFHCLPVLPRMLAYLSIDSTKLRCLPHTTRTFLLWHKGTLITGLKPCNPTNNFYGCTVYPEIKGKVFYDFNNNGIEDLNEPAAAGLKMKLSNERTSFTNNNGGYSLVYDTLGSVKLIASAPNFFKAVPDTSTFNFTSYDTTVTKNIALQRTVIKDSIHITLVASWARARPGFVFPYIVHYKNSGSTNLGPTTVTLTYDSSRLVFDSASNPALSHSNNRLTLILPALDFGSKGSFAADFTVKPTVPLGDTVRSWALMTSGILSAADTTATRVSGAFDPNDKTAPTKVTPTQVSAGTDIKYLIRFQNTGTDTAFHVVITDTLSSMLQAGTLEMISTSHLCKPIVNGNIIAFEMRDILLPDSNVNEKASHGYIYFKIKARTDLVAGNFINNKAAIYFDYNSPVITNTARTDIVPESTIPLTLLDFRGYKLPGEKIRLQWTIANQINTKNFLIERSSNGQVFSKTGEVSSVGYGDNNYSFIADNINTPVVFFRLKMLDKDGAFTYSPVISFRNDGKGKGLFTIFTNPVRDDLVLTDIAPSLMNTEARLVNATGVVVKKFMITSFTQVIPVGDLATGVYYLNAGGESEKLVVGK